MDFSIAISILVGISSYFLTKYIVDPIIEFRDLKYKVSYILLSNRYALTKITAPEPELGRELKDLAANLFSAFDKCVLLANVDILSICHELDYLAEICEEGLSPSTSRKDISGILEYISDELKIPTKYRDIQKVYFK